jgi:glycosyltransferase involved in cell wall biosynthesis
VIPAKNEAKYLPSLLNSLVQQDYAHRGRIKVFVADASSTDGTADVARSFADRLDLTVIEGGIPSVGRNRGAQRSDSEFVLFLDADVELRDPTMLRRALLRMKSQQLHCLTVDIVCGEGNWMDRFLYRANSRMQRLSSWIMPFGTGMFLLFDRKRFTELGGFHETALFAEDFLLTKQVSPLRFCVLKGEVHTSNRRFRRTGHARMIFLFFWTMLNSSNRRHFERDHGYWKEAPATAE